MDELGPLVSLVEQAPVAGAVIVVVVVFLRHLRAESEANRLVMGELRQALDALRERLNK